MRLITSVTDWLCSKADFMAYGIRNAKEYTVQVEGENK